MVVIYMIRTTLTATMMGINMVAGQSDPILHQSCPYIIVPNISEAYYALMLISMLFAYLLAEFALLHLYRQILKNKPGNTNW